MPSLTQNQKLFNTDITLQLQNQATTSAVLAYTAALVDQCRLQCITTNKIGSGKKSNNLNNGNGNGKVGEIISMEEAVCVDRCVIRANMAVHLYTKALVRSVEEC